MNGIMLCIERRDQQMTKVNLNGINLITEWNRGKWIFNDIHEYGYPYYHVHPYKQEAVKYLVDNRLDWVTNIIIFGSSVGNWHMWWKDVDICLIWCTEESYTQMLPSGASCDVLFYANLAELLDGSQEIGSIRYHICKEGVMVFAKD